MRPVGGLHLYLSSFAISVILVIVLAGASGIPHFYAVGALLLPGGLLAALVFPQGVESDSATAFLVLAGVLDSVLYAFPVMGIWKLVAGRKRDSSEGT
jgi:hypothetical protein